MRIFVKTFLSLSFSAILPPSAFAQRPAAPTPRLHHPSQDPWVTLHDGLYHHVKSGRNGIDSAMRQATGKPCARFHASSFM
jgi:hypothetical protein